MGGVAMSLINKMLQDLEARQPADLSDLPATAAVRKRPGRRFSLSHGMLVLLLLVATAAAWTVGRHMATPVGPTQHVVLAMAEPVGQQAESTNQSENRESDQLMHDGNLNEVDPPIAENVTPQASSAISAIDKGEASEPAKNASSNHALAPDFNDTKVIAAQKKSALRPASELAAPVPAHTTTSAAVISSPARDTVSFSPESQSATFSTLPRVDQAEMSPPMAEPTAVQTVRKQMLPSQQLSVSEPSPIHSLQDSAQSASAGKAQPAERETGAFGIPAGVSKEVTPSTPKQRAEDAYRRATVLAQQGRTNEAIASLEQALAQDGGHGAARQTLVGLLLEQQRQQDAVRVLQEGLTLDRSQTGLAMLLARLQVERAALQPAIQTLEASLGAARKPDYHAFLGALYQRAGQHPQAMESYRQALRQSPQNGLWWMGLAISFQASNQPEDARSAFLRAQDSGMLSSELEAFVRQRLAQLS